MDAATNRIHTLSGADFSYDASGNMTNDGANTIVYDGENKVASNSNPGSGLYAYAYDGNGLRVKKTPPSGAATVYVFSARKVIAEYAVTGGSSTLSREYIYAGGRLAASISGSTTSYYHQDHLSNRLVTDSSGTVTEQTGTFPYGESWYTASGEKLVFTTYERDAESGNDYAMARTYSSALGRFTAVDPLNGDISNPQSLNRYAYVGNDPVNVTDPTGMGWSDDSICADQTKKGGGSGGSAYDPSQDASWWNMFSAAYGGPPPPMYLPVASPQAGEHDLLFLPGAPPKGLVNKSGDPGYHGGEEFKKVPSSYTTMVDRVYCQNKDCSNIPEVLQNPKYLGATLIPKEHKIVDPYGDWGKFYKAMGMQDPSGYVPPLPSPPATCAQAWIDAMKQWSKDISDYTKKHPGVPPPPELLVPPAPTCI